MHDQFSCGQLPLKHRSLTHVSFYRQLQTSWLDMFRQFAWVVVWFILFCWSYKFYLSIIIVGRGFTSNNASKENDRFFMTSSKRSCQHIENETATDEGKVGGGERADKSGMSDFIFSTPPPTFYFAPLPLEYLENT